VTILVIGKIQRNTCSHFRPTADIHDAIIFFGLGFKSSVELIPFSMRG